MYTGSGYVLGRSLFSLKHFPAMLAVGTGLCINNAWAVMEGVLGKKSAFVRTPKSGSTEVRKKSGRYKADSSLIIALIETILGIYCFYTLWVYIGTAKYLFGFFIGAYAFGLTSFGVLSLWQGYVKHLFAPFVLFVKTRKKRSFSKNS
jgi:hypothetical protein